MAYKSSKSLGERLIDQSDCKTCHNKEVKTIGPSYIEIAEAYQTTPDNVNTLVKKVINGGSGIWGEQVMSAHPDLQDRDAEEMINYILGLDNDDGAGEESSPAIRIPPLLDIESSEVRPGLIAKIFQYNDVTGSVHTMGQGRPDYDGVFSTISFGNSDFGELVENFYMQFDGLLLIKESGIYNFRLISDDGSVLYIGNQLVIDHDGYHGADARNARIELEEGFYPISLKFFQGLGGKALQLFWKTPSGGAFEIIPVTNYRHLSSDENSLTNAGLPFGNNQRFQVMNFR